MGCGEGLSLVRLLRHIEVIRIVDVVPNATAPKLTRRHQGFRVFRGSALVLPFDRGSYDVITCFDVLRHLAK